MDLKKIPLKKGENKRMLEWGFTYRVYELPDMLLLLNELRKKKSLFIAMNKDNEEKINELLKSMRVQVRKLIVEERRNRADKTVNRR